MNKPANASQANLLDYLNDNGTNNPNTFADKSLASQKMYKLNAATNRIGLTKMLKVMAGDKVSMLAKSYYRYAGGTVANTPFSANSNPVNGGNNVKAAVNYIILDEHFKYVSGGFDPVQTAAVGGLKPHFLQDISILKNGYIYIYCSNESNIDVFFDNLEVVHTRGPLLEETQYYPFGLTMAGISSKALSFGGSGNNYKYVGKELLSNEFSDGSGLEEYDFGSRFYDQQVGRWYTQDPLVDKWPEYTPYTYTLNNPINLVNLDGEDVYILYYTIGNNHGDNMFKAAAETRKTNIENGKNFDSEKDKVIMIGLEDISDTQNMTEWAVANYSDKYGQTAEVGVWSHSGLDGPIGTKAAKNDALYKGSTQMSLEGWGKINFNWKESGTTMGVYGCNSANEVASNNFAQNISGLDNYKNVEIRGQSTSTFPSLYTDIRATTIARNYNWPNAWSQVGGTYMVGGNRNEGSKATTNVPFSGDFPKANLMNVYRNGQKLRSDYQTRTRKNKIYASY